MNQRDLSEIKRRLSPDHRNASVICGCYVSNTGEMISSFTANVATMAQGELEKFMTLFKKVLSGKMEQNLLAIDFTDEDMAETKPYGVVEGIYTTELKDENALNDFYQRMLDYVKHETQKQAQSVDASKASSNYLILMMHDGYDVPFRDKNGDMDRERGNSIFSYILCALCPVKQTKPSLHYVADRGEFHATDADWMVTMPELGFMFPAFEDRGGNISRAMYYTKSVHDTHDDFVRTIFGVEPPAPSSAQKETLGQVLETVLSEECRMDVVQSFHETVTAMLEEHNADKTTEPLMLDKKDISRVLENSGVSEEKREIFENEFTEVFGMGASIPAVNVVSPAKFEVHTPAVSIKVKPEMSELVSTREIDGRVYLTVLVDGDVEVNGIRVNCK